MVVVMIVCAVAWLCCSPSASAHVVPTSSILLEVGDGAVEATVGIPLSDLESATGIDLDDESQATIDAHAAQIQQYLLDHFVPTSDDGQTWTVDDGSLTVSTVGNAQTTGLYPQLETVFTLTPPPGSDRESFNLGYDAVVDKVATHTVIVTASSESDGSISAVGTVRRSTVTNTVQPLHVDLASDGGSSGFTGLFSLGVEHIQEGTDHQLFLLTLLLPAPLVAAARRWGPAVSARRSMRRIATITLSFTLGHSVTLALGALGVPVPQQLVESLIAVSILVAALHAVRPIFPGREALVAASFGLVHGLAFSEALRELDLTGAQLVVALLGFNFGIEAMQLVIVALVLPPLILLARAERYQTLRIVAAVATAVAAVGWLGARVGIANPVADVADRIGILGLPVIAALWAVALILVLHDRRRSPAPTSAGTHVVFSQATGGRSPE
ncbi:membrane protein [Kineosporia sp. NBRC 101731]|nr:membrane protein [Kineosporia sp. NBRC 101731]